MSVRNKNRYALPAPGYTPQDALESIAFIDNGSDKLAALFSPWHQAGRYYQKLAAKLHSQGYDVVIYTLSPWVLQPDAGKVVASYRQATKAIAHDLQQRCEAKQYSYVHLIGTSIGNIPVMLLAAQFSHFDEVTMATAASDLAKCLWDGIRTCDLRDSFRHSGLTKATLAEQWHSLAPINYVQYLANKKINLIVARKDLVIPTKYQLEFYEALAAVNDNVTVRLTRAGHYASILRYCLTARVT